MQINKLHVTKSFVMYNTEKITREVMD